MELRFHFIELNSSVFSKSCWSKRLQALSGTSCLYQKRDSKLKVGRTLLTNHRKIIMWGHLRIAHKETHSVNNTCHSFPCSSLNSASLLLFVSSILLQVKIRISKVVFFAWRITQTCQSQSPRHFSVNSMFTAQFYRVIRCLRPFTETIGQGRIGKDNLGTLQLKV